MSDGFSFHGVYTLTRYRAGEVKVFEAHNTLTWQGAAALLAGGLSSKAWEIAFKTGGEGNAGDTAQTKPWRTVSYASAGNAKWIPAVSSGLDHATADNYASPAHVVIDKPSVTTDGICIQSSDGTVLLSVAEWYAEQDLLEGDEFNITYALECAVS